MIYAVRGLNGKDHLKTCKKVYHKKMALKHVAGSLKREEEGQIKSHSVVTVSHLQYALSLSMPSNFTDLNM